MAKYKSIDLFAGIGGIRRGFDLAFGSDIETVFVSEIDEFAQRTYRANYGEETEIAGDITKISEEDVPEFDICLAGFPCQAFSMAGHHMGFDDNYKGMTRGTLFRDVVRICEDSNRIPDSFFDILQILRMESDNLLRTYKVENHPKDIVLYVNGDKRSTIPRNDLDTEAAYMLSEIQSGGERSSFPIDHADKIMKKLECKTIKAKSTDKADIRMIVHDSFSGLETKVGFSIKSKLGAASSLLNASPATNFRYVLPDIQDDVTVESINSIATRNKIVDRVHSAGRMVFDGCTSETFEGNLVMIDSRMPEIIAQMLLFSYQHGIMECYQLVSMLEAQNPLGYSRTNAYAYKVKRCLSP